MPLGDQAHQPVGEDRADDQVVPLRLPRPVPEGEGHVAVALAEHLDRARRLGLDEETLVPGCAARSAASAVGTSVELPLGKETSRTRPARSPAIAATSSSAAVSPARMPEAWRTRTSPAWVRRISRPVRMSSGVPAEASRAFICWLTAGWVQPSSRAAAEKEPVAATARRTRR